MKHGAKPTRVRSGRGWKRRREWGVGLPPLPARSARLDTGTCHAEAGADQDTTQVPRVTMLPAELLQPGEIIILLLKPSPWFIVLEPLRSLLALLAIFVATVALMRVIGEPVGSRDLLALALLLAAGRVIWQFIVWLGHVYVLTDRRVIRVRGVFRIQIFEAQLKNITHTTTLFSLRERLLGLGTIGFATAGSAGLEAFWRMIDRPMEVHQTIVRAMDRYR